MDDLYQVADVQGVIEVLRGAVREVDAAVRADCDAALVESVTVVEEHGVGHLGVVDRADVVGRLERDPEAAGRGSEPLAAVRDRDRAVALGEGIARYIDWIRKQSDIRDYFSEASDILKNKGIVHRVAR